MKYILLWALAETRDLRRVNSRIRDIPLDEYIENVERLMSIVEDVEVEIGAKGIPEIPKLESDPILNFRFNDKGLTMDFSHEPMVITFMEYLNNLEKRQWPQKCLDSGLPLYTSLPLQNRFQSGMDYLVHAYRSLF